MLIRVYVLIGLLLQNEYAAILAKRVNEEKAKKTELRSKYIFIYPPVSNKSTVSFATYLAIPSPGKLWYTQADTRSQNVVPHQ